MKGDIMQKITPNLWFDNKAEEAVNFYVSVFKNSKILNISHYTKASAEVSGMPVGSVLTIEFVIEGQKFLALNGGPQFKFSEAVSFIINCDTQDEIDYYWNRLTEGGDESAQVCGWLKDKYGLSWQVVPTILDEMFSDKSEKGERAMEAFLKMKKIEIEKLKQAYMS